MSGALRLFFAIPAPDTVRALAVDVQARLRGRRAALPALEGLHVTLAFLGAQAPEAVAPLLAAAGRAVAGHAPFPLATAGLGGFPRLSAARLLYLGFAPQPALGALAGDLRAALTAQGAPFDAKPLRPHLTLARLKEPADFASLAPPGPGVAFTVDHVVLYQSLLSSQGSIYQSLGALPLVG